MIYSTWTFFLSFSNVITRFLSKTWKRYIPILVVKASTIRYAMIIIKNAIVMVWNRMVIMIVMILITNIWTLSSQLFTCRSKVFSHRISTKSGCILDLMLFYNLKCFMQTTSHYYLAFRTVATVLKIIEKHIFYINGIARSFYIFKPKVIKFWLKLIFRLKVPASPSTKKSGAIFHPFVF